MKPATKNELDGDAWRLYDYITRHFIATLAKDCTYLTTTTTFNINDEIFTVSGKTLIDPGFTSVMTWQVNLIWSFSVTKLNLFISGVWKKWNFTRIYGKRKGAHHGCTFSRTPDRSAWLFNRIRTYHPHGETWNWYRRFNSRAHQ